MKNKAIIINGALRIKGNTDSLVNWIIEGAAESDVEIDLMTLRELSIGNCTGCYNCMSKSTCSIEDDMTGIRTSMLSAQLLIFASPLYW
ncbi:MAG: flavodoxin family protein [Pseudomonadota bacterium]